MSRIDASVSAQIGEISRPRQVMQDAHLQAQQVQVSEANAVPDGRHVAHGDLLAVAAQMKQVIETASGKSLRFGIYQDTDELYVEISDQRTGEVIKEIPSKDMLELHSRLSKMVGLIIDGKA